MDKAKKKQIKKITTWVLLAALVAGLTAMPLLAKAEAEADGPVATVHSGTVTKGTVQTALHGGGTLTTEGIETIKLPSGVKIKEFLVKNGDSVTAGTPLASVDKVSVMTAITSVTETMEYLQEEMRSAKNEKISSTVSATAGGRIKKVYAGKGDSVQDVMLRDGALALLSLDGLMAVKIEKELELLTGDTVTVTLAHGEAVTGRIASNLDGLLVITLEDNGYEIGQTVTVFAKDGSEVGTGELYIYSPWTAAAFSGIIQNVNAKEETKVSAGSPLFTLTDTDFHSKLEYMSALHREYEELMQDLFQMYNTGIIDAPCDGTISGIDKDSPHLLASEDSEPVQADLLTAEDPGWQLMLLSSVTYDLDSGEICDPANPDCQAQVHTRCIKACTSADSEAGCTAERHYNNCIRACQSAPSLTGCPAEVTKHTLTCIRSCNPTDGICAKDSGYHKAECVKSCRHGDTPESCPKGKQYPHYLDCIVSCIQSNGSKDCPATKHLKSCIEACTHEDNIGICKGSLNHYPDCIQCCANSDSGSKFCPSSKHVSTCFFAAMEYRAKVALVTQVGSNALVVRWDSSHQEYDVEKVGSGWKFSNGIDFNTQLLVEEGTISVSNPGAYKPGDIIFAVTGYKGKEAVWTGIPVFVHINSVTGPDSMPDLDKLLGGLNGMMNFQMPDLSAFLNGFNFSFFAPSPVEEDKLFDLEGSTLMTVSPHEKVSLIITLDEQDIAKVRVGQKATVKVEALSGETFEAVVTEVAVRGSNNGGSSKFAAKLELPKAKNMLDGMSATASLPLEKKESVPTIPVMALAEEGTQTVVYTALDEKTGELAKPVPVVIGLSDGLTAEILSGLEVDDTYYYSYYDVLEEDLGVEERFTLT